MRQFVAYCKLVQLVGLELNIEQQCSAKNQLALIFVLKKFEEFFWKQIPRLNTATFNKWDANLAKYGFAKCDSTVFIQLQHMGYGHHLYMFRRRAEAEHSNALQKVFRQEILHQNPESHDFMADLDLETQESLLKANLMDVEDACLIIQCAERMYQAISRFVYLTDVRKKAMNLHISQKN
uniref:Uncharacterized protein n=1 Tax=Ditylenchus dipsaci TaxID=166011 RepID=A0A915ESE1_9BILA